MSKDKIAKPSAFGRLTAPARPAQPPAAPASAPTASPAPDAPAPAAVPAAPAADSSAQLPATVPAAPIARQGAAASPGAIGDLSPAALALIGPAPMPGMQAFHSLRRATIPFEQIRVVPEHLVRQVDQRQVDNLVRSIAWLGLFHPLMLDSTSELIAGQHRHLAIKTLKENLPEIYERQFPNGLIQAVWAPCSYTEDPELTRAYATVENRHRKNFSTDQVRQLIDQIRQDQNVVQRRGRLAEGERSLVNELSFVLQVSHSAAKRLLTKAGEVKLAPTAVVSQIDRACTVHRHIDKLIGKFLDHLGPEHEEARAKIHAARASLGDVAAALRPASESSDA